MGTINYRTSDYITMAIKPFEFDENEIIDMLEENEVDTENIDISEYIADLVNGFTEDALIFAKEVLSRYHFDYYHVKIEYGYYEGFSLDIENNYGYCYDSWEDRRYANKEITKLKQMLIELADVGMVACYPFWIMRYEDYKGTLECIDVAVKNMRAEVKATPTWNQLVKRNPIVKKGERKGVLK